MVLQFTPSVSPMFAQVLARIPLAETAFPIREIVAAMLPPGAALESNCEVHTSLAKW